MKKESVLILGAGLMQKPAILAAKKNSLKTFVVDANPAAESIKYADTFSQIDLKDRKGIFEYAKQLSQTENLVGIFTSGTDFSASVSYAAEKLHLPCHSFESALNASDKARMRMCFEKNGVPSPVFLVLSGEISEKDAVCCAEKIGFPCVVKPVDNMGARGCRIVRNKDEVYSSVMEAAENSRSKTVILEEFMTGDEYSIDALIYNGTMTITGFADRHIYYPPYFIEMGHTMPAVLDEKKRLELIAAFALGVKSLGLTQGAAKADIKYTKDGPKIGEIAARLSGGYMSGWTFPYAASFDLTENALLIASGKMPRALLKERKPVLYAPHAYSAQYEKPFELFEIPSKKTSAERAWISIPGKIQSISGLKKVSATPCIKNVFPRPISCGDEVDFPHNNVEKCGNIISLSKNYRKAIDFAVRARKKVFIRLEPCNARTDAFLHSSEENSFPPMAFPEYLALKTIGLCGIIKENTSILKNLCAGLKNIVESDSKDWNGLSILETARLFDKICRRHPELNAFDFWNALLRGGIQGAVYFSDSKTVPKSL